MENYFKKEIKFLKFIRSLTKRKTINSHKPIVQNLNKSSPPWLKCTFVHNAKWKHQELKTCEVHKLKKLLMDT